METALDVDRSLTELAAQPEQVYLVSNFFHSYLFFMDFERYMISVVSHKDFLSLPDFT